MGIAEPTSLVRLEEVGNAIRRGVGVADSDSPSDCVAPIPAPAPDEEVGLAKLASVASRIDSSPSIIDSSSSNAPSYP